MGSVLAPVTQVSPEDETIGSDELQFVQQDADSIQEALQSPGIDTSSARVLPSETKLSNVGTTSFTGVVNWHAIPGGFQPLQQTIGNQKRIHQISRFQGGINQRSSPRDIADYECQEAINVSFSEPGRIKSCGRAINTDNSITLTNPSNASIPGYGLFEFSAPADQDDTAGEVSIILFGDGDQVDAYSSSGSNDAGWMDMNGTDSAAVAQIYYASSNGVYVADAKFNSNNNPIAKIYVSRVDQVEAVSGWTAGKPLIDAPDTNNDDAAAAGKATIQSGGTDILSTTNGSLEVNIHNQNTGGWNGEYFFYVSWLFDGKCETQLTAIGTETFADDELRLNPSLSHDNTNPFGGDKRIEGARIYFKEANTTQRFLLAELSLRDGAKGGLDDTFVAWTLDSSVHDLTDADRLIFKNPPTIKTYLSENKYFADELYDTSADLDEDDTNGGTAVTGSSAKIVAYSTVVAGSGGIIFIGNVKFEGEHFPDRMMFSMKNKPAVFPRLNTIDPASSDGTPIRALAAWKDTILQFKENGLYVVNVTDVSNPFIESAYRDCGVANPCQVFTTSFGVMFVNKYGVFIYDGSKVISLTSGKFDWINQSGIVEEISNGSDAHYPSIGYDPRSQDIIVIKSIDDDTATNEGWIFNMQTQSWTETDIITLAGTNTRISNFIISSKGFLSYKQSGTTTLLNYNRTPPADQLITYISKDIDFGSPTQTKKIFKIYVTYKGDGSGLYFTYGANGDTSPLTAMTNSETGNAYLQNAGTGDNNIATYTLDSHPSDLTSITLKFTDGSVGTDFEINDISIVYRLRPAK